MGGLETQTTTSTSPQTSCVWNRAMRSVLYVAHPRRVWVRTQSNFDGRCIGGQKDGIASPGCSPPLKGERHNGIRLRMESAACITTKQGARTRANPFNGSLVSR